MPDLALLPGPHSPQRVVVALPLGVLKRGSLQWQPPLPDANQRALDGLGVGLLNKVRPGWEVEQVWGTGAAR